jgi:hypothetical protein
MKDATPFVDDLCILEIVERIDILLRSRTCVGLSLFRRSKDDMEVSVCHHQSDCLDPSRDVKYGSTSLN